MRNENSKADHDASGHGRLGTFGTREKRGSYQWLLLIPVLALGYGFYTQFDRVREILAQYPVIETERPQVAASLPTAPTPAASVSTPAADIREPAAQAAGVALPVASAPQDVAPAPPPLSALFPAPSETVRVRAVGKTGLVAALRNGELRLATAGDFGRWKISHARSGGGNAGRSFDERVAHMDAYVVQKDFEIPDDLTGAHAVVFLLEPGVPFPRGDAGHSPILDIDGGACIGAICRMMMPQE